jgi:hypothetical protein
VKGTFRFLIGVLVAIFLALLLFFVSRLMFMSKLGGPDHVDILSRFSGQSISCEHEVSGLKFDATFTYNKEDHSLEVRVKDEPHLLKYAGSKDIEDHFEGPQGERVKIDPEIILTGFSGLYSVCSLYR